MCSVCNCAWQLCIAASYRAVSVRGQLPCSCCFTQCYNLLHRYCSEAFEPPSLRFERNAHGKPQLSWEEADGQPEPPIHFSLTHTSSLLGKITALPASHSANLLMACHTMHDLTGLLFLIKACTLPMGCTSLHKHSHQYNFPWKQLQCLCSFMQQSVDQLLNMSRLICRHCCFLWQSGWAGCGGEQPSYQGRPSQIGSQAASTT